MRKTNDVVRPRLPPLNAIKAFEAAARLGSFTRAAEELSVTHGAISRQIRLLEDWLGMRLFVRTSRNAVPTQTGADLRLVLRRQPGQHHFGCDTAPLEVNRGGQFDCAGAGRVRYA